MRIKAFGHCRFLLCFGGSSVGSSSNARGRQRSHSCKVAFKYAFLAGQEKGKP